MTFSVQYNKPLNYDCMNEWISFKDANKISEIGTVLYNAIQMIHDLDLRELPKMFVSNT